MGTLRTKNPYNNRTNFTSYSFPIDLSEYTYHYRPSLVGSVDVQMLLTILHGCVARLDSD